MNTTAAALRGTTTVADKAVSKIVERAADEALPRRTAGRTSGSATVRGRRASVTLRLALPYPAPLSGTALHVQAHVTERTRELTGLSVAPVRLTVVRLQVPSGPIAPADTADTPISATSRKTLHRWWSERRTPGAVLALLLAAGCAGVTADFLRVHVTRRQAAAWREWTVGWLSTHGPGDLPFIVGGAAVALLGLWMVVLGATPGRRGQLTLFSAMPEQDIAVDRAAVTGLLRDAVGDIDGIGAARIRAGRRRATVRATLAFGDREQARTWVTTAVHKTVTDCRLRHEPRVRVRVVPAPSWRPPEPATEPGHAIAPAGGEG